MKFYFGTNLKMNLGRVETKAFVSQLVSWLQARSVRHNLQLWAAASYTGIESAVVARGSNDAIWIGGQNVHWAERGAFTGEISAGQLLDSGADFVLLGHAERRGLFGETNDEVRKKMASCTRAGLRVMLCVGEGTELKRIGAGARYVAEQLDTALAECPRPDDVMVLYEPVWAIGEGGMAAESGYVAEAFAGIRATLAKRYGAPGENIPLLYGGSVTAENAAGFATIPGCAGVGVGRAAWRAQDFIRVLENILRTLPADE